MEQVAAGGPANFESALDVTARARADLENSRLRWEALPPEARREIPGPGRDRLDAAAIARQAKAIRDDIAALRENLWAESQAGIEERLSGIARRLAEVAAAQADRRERQAARAGGPGSPPGHPRGRAGVPSVPQGPDRPPRGDRRRAPLAAARSLCHRRPGRHLRRAAGHARRSQADRPSHSQPRGPPPRRGSRPGRRHRPPRRRQAPASCTSTPPSPGSARPGETFRPRPATRPPGSPPYSGPLTAACGKPKPKRTSTATASRSPGRSPPPAGRLYRTRRAPRACHAPPSQRRRRPDDPLHLASSSQPRPASLASHAAPVRSPRRSLRFGQPPARAGPP